LVPEAIASACRSCCESRPSDPPRRRLPREGATQERRGRRRKSHAPARAATRPGRSSLI
jgi:hypothetical protein